MGGTDRGILFVISAPSGTGKSTLAGALVDSLSGLRFSISYTTRRRRDGERDGREYHFVDDARFDAMVNEGAFLEWAEVFGSRYGTARRDTGDVLAGGRDLVLDIDVQGARKVRKSEMESVGIFVLPPHFSVLEERLRSRASESEPDLSRRLARARREAEEFRDYDYVVVNDELERASTEIRAIVLAERSRTRRRTAAVRNIVNTFPPDPGADRGDLP